MNMCRRTLGRGRPATCTILYYHEVRRDDGEQFARQMDRLVRLAQPVQIDITGLPEVGRRYVAVTFDDGFESLLNTALPALMKRKIPCAIFVIAGGLGKVPSWMGSPDGGGGGERLMTASQLRELSTDCVLIGSHTVSHPNLPGISSAEAKREIRESRLILEGLLGREIRLFSFPYGAFNEQVVELCKEAGYERVFTTQPLAAFSGPNSFVTGRVPAEPTDWPLEFRLKVIGAYQWLPWAFFLKREVSRFLPRPFRQASRTYEPVVFR